MLTDLRNVRRLFSCKDRPLLQMQKITVCRNEYLDCPVSYLRTAVNVLAMHAEAYLEGRCELVRIFTSYKLALSYSLLLSYASQCR